MQHMEINTAMVFLLMAYASPDFSLFTIYDIIRHGLVHFSNQGDGSGGSKISKSQSGLTPKKYIKRDGREQTNGTVPLATLG
ncbi:MAG: hypothetical protein GXX04_07490 [Clostridiaceae bacterium]|nr:hypothetical protein [Clostridiaceae bacterium]